MEAEATETRWFGLADMMILVVATAVGLAPLKPHLDIQSVMPVTSDMGWREATFLLINYFLGCVVPLLLSWTIASLALAARRPRPPLRHLAHRPGFLLCLAALVGFAYAFAYTMPNHFTSGPLVLDRYVRTTGSLLWHNGPHNAGLATLGAWVAVVCHGAPWRAVDWRDRLGRAMGAGWLLLLLAVFARDLAPHLEKLLN